MHGTRSIVMTLEDVGGVWETASIKDREKRESELLAGKKVGAALFIVVHADTRDDEDAILASIPKTFP